MLDTTEPVYSYTRKQAIEDGYQIEVPRSLSGRIGFKIGVFLTRPIFDFFVENSSYHTDKEGVDRLLAQVHRAITEIGASEERRVVFDGLVRTSSGIQRKTVYVEIGATDIDDPAPALTVMSSTDL